MIFLVQFTQIEKKRNFRQSFELRFCSRDSFGCGFLSEQEQVLVFGGVEFVVNQNSTVELLNGMENNFTLVDDMPLKLYGMSVVNNPIQNNVLFVSGGFNYVYPYGDYSNAILKVTCDLENCVWTTLNQKLKSARFRHVSFMINRNFNCTTESSKQKINRLKNLWS